MPWRASDAPDVLGTPPARQPKPLLEGHPPVAEVLVREVYLRAVRAGYEGHGGEEVAARGRPDPRCQDALGCDEEAGLLEELAHGPTLEVLARGQATGRRLPGAGRPLEEQHAPVREDGQDARDEVGPNAHLASRARCSQPMTTRNHASPVVLHNFNVPPAAGTTPGHRGAWRSGGSAPCPEVPPRSGASSRAARPRPRRPGGARGGGGCLRGRRFSSRPRHKGSNAR